MRERADRGVDSSVSVFVGDDVEPVEFDLLPLPNNTFHSAIRSRFFLQIQ